MSQRLRKICQSEHKRIPEWLSLKLIKLREIYDLVMYIWSGNNPRDLRKSPNVNSKTFNDYF